MNKKLLLTVVATSIIISVGAILNVRLNTQNENHSVVLNKTEALSGESWNEWDDYIIFSGLLTNIPIRSLAPQPLQAVKHSSYISVHYLVNLNNIAVQIVNSSGQTVYSNVVNPVAGGQLSISLAGLSSGGYTLVFTSANGGCMHGDFEI
ncbi:MAG: DUF3244 domain-containing protein [Prevotellaceae bacterium]|jgi:hypothetical protein|nr:DUF3244 domain-containing protein [Prevotellaceae bacterium]